jgi:hypothetical protein
VNWREAAGLVRFLTEDCCADLHLAVTEPRAGATVGTPPKGVLGTAATDACCTTNEPSVRAARGPATKSSQDSWAARGH